MDFGFTDEQQAIKDTAHQMLAARSPLSAVRKAAESGSRDDALWKEICELGWPGIAIAEEHGGQGLGIVGLAVLCEELGYACAAVPYLSHVVAALFVSIAGSEEQRGRWLPSLASGESRGASAFEPGEGNLVLDPDGADLLTLAEGRDKARVVEAADAEIEPVELID